VQRALARTGLARSFGIRIVVVEPGIVVLALDLHDTGGWRRRRCPLRQSIAWPMGAGPHLDSSANLALDVGS